MQYVVCYDISDDRRRDRMARTLLDYGQRVQESVFVANLDEELAGRMTARLRKLAGEGESDRVHVFRLCGTCAGMTEVMGSGEVVADKEYYVL